MAYVDHAFSISDEDMMMEGSHADNNRGPIKEIALAVSLLVFGTLAIFLGIFMAINKVGGDTAHGLFFCYTWWSFVYTRVLLYKDCILCLQGL